MPNKIELQSLEMNITRNMPMLKRYMLHLLLLAPPLDNKYTYNQHLCQTLRSLIIVMTNSIPLSLINA
jgi:hypothetical protein